MRKELNIDFIGKRKIYYTLSLVLIAAGILVSVFMGVKLDIQFKGGTILNYSYSGNLDMDKADAFADKQLGTNVNTKSELNAITGQKTVVFELDKTLNSDDQAKFDSSISKQFTENKLGKSHAQAVSPQMGQKFLFQSVLALLIASLCIVVYIWIRFRNIGGLPAGLTAFVALIHDILMVFAAFSIMRIPLNDSFIAVALTIFGYSINDTIVVYDRVRENRRLYGSKMMFKDAVNKSINQSFARSINTTLTTFVSITVLCVFAMLNHLDSITNFALPMMVGVITGCYSTICIAGPLWVGWETHKEKAAEAEKERLAREKEERKNKKKNKEA